MRRARTDSTMRRRRAFAGFCGDLVLVGVLVVRLGSVGHVVPAAVERGGEVERGDLVAGEQVDVAA